MNMICRVCCGLIGFLSLLYANVCLFSFSAFILNLSVYFPGLAVIFPNCIDTMAPTENDVITDLKWNFMLMAFFFVPHSLMARKSTKHNLGKNKEGISMYRTLYVAQSALSMQLIVTKWRPIWTNVIIW